MVSKLFHSIFFSKVALIFVEAIQKIPWQVLKMPLLASGSRCKINKFTEGVWLFTVFLEASKKYRYCTPNTVVSNQIPLLPVALTVFGASSQYLEPVPRNTVAGQQMPLLRFVWNDWPRPKAQWKVESLRTLENQFWVHKLFLSNIPDKTMT